MLWWSILLQFESFNLYFYSANSLQKSLHMPWNLTYWADIDWTLDTQYSQMSIHTEKSGKKVSFKKTETSERQAVGGQPSALSGNRVKTWDFMDVWMSSINLYLRTHTHAHTHTQHTLMQSTSHPPSHPICGPWNKGADEQPLSADTILGLSSVACMVTEKRSVSFAFQRHLTSCCLP